MKERSNENNLFRLLYQTLRSGKMHYVYLVLGFIVIIAYTFFKQINKYWKKRQVPYPKPALIFGNTGKAVTRTIPMSKICNDIYKKYEGFAYVGMFNLWRPAILLRDTELIKDVLIKQFNKFHDNWFHVEQEVDPVLAKNPFVMMGQEWKMVRSQLTGQYTAAKLKTIIPLMQTVTKNLTTYIKNQSKLNNSCCFEAKELAARFTGDNLFTCAYGLDGKFFADDVPEVFKMRDELSSSNKLVQIKQIIGLFFPWLRRLLKVTFLGSPVSKMFHNIILEAIKYRDDNCIVRKDYLDFLRDLRQSSCEEDHCIIAHAFTLFLNAFETSAISLAFTLYELSLNPDIQSKARTEIEVVLKKHNGNLSHEALQELEYLDNVISESLRKNPIILFMCRLCTKDYKFPPPKGPGTGKNVLIKKGTQIFVPIYGIHTDPHLYPNPERFDPDRFTEAAKNRRPKGSFLGFGEGPRICLGSNYAVMQIKLALVAILSEFELRMNHKTKVPYERELLQVVNVPKDGIFVDFQLRT